MKIYRTWDRPIQVKYLTKTNKERHRTEYVTERREVKIGDIIFDIVNHGGIEKRLDVTSRLVSVLYSLVLDSKSEESRESLLNIIKEYDYSNCGFYDKVTDDHVEYFKWEIVDE